MPVAELSLSSANYYVDEGGGSAVVTINRTGDSSGAVTVEYRTGDTAAGNCGESNTGLASSRCDYETTLGTLNFAPGEMSKTVSIPIVDDGYAEGSESFSFALTNVSGASLGLLAGAAITVTDNETDNRGNPISDPRSFVRLHYLDFLNREPDASGLDFWTNQITACGADTNCIEVKRINVSAAFFLSIEFQETGYLVERLYKVSYADAEGASTFPSPHRLTVPIITLNEFLADTRAIGRGLIVGEGNWQRQLEQNKTAFLFEFVQRPRFTASYRTTLTPAAFVNQLFQNAAVTPTLIERSNAINEFGSGIDTSDLNARARVLRDVAESATVRRQELNRAFVLMQYFGYLRRNPSDPQDADYSGYDFWLSKLNQFAGSYVDAEMVKAFISSAEYKARLGP